MFIAYAFVGKLPSYIKESIHQSRCFFEGDIYLIIDDINSIHLKDIEKYNVKIIDYNNVKSIIFLDIVNKNKHKFCIVKELNERELLFIRCCVNFLLSSL